MTRHLRLCAAALAFLALLPASSARAQLRPPAAAEPQRFLVRFRPGLPQAARAAFLARVGAQSHQAYAQVGWDRVDLRATESARARIQEFAADTAVAAIEPIVYYHALLTPNDPSFDEQDDLLNVGQRTGGKPGADISATRAWDITTGDSSVVICILDTGVDYNHPDLLPNILRNAQEIDHNGLDDDHNGYPDDVLGWNFVDGSSDPYDDNNHGTHVAGTAAALGGNGFGTAGIAWHCKILPVKFLDYRGIGTNADAIAGIEYAIERGARVINASWGGGDSSLALHDAIAAAGAHGIVFVAAAGNDHLNNDVAPFYPANFHLPNMITVAAVDNRDLLASFSNFGPAHVDVAAPGVDILSTLPNAGWTYDTGTSMAAPHVSGVAALVASRHPDWSPQQIRARIMATVDPLRGFQTVVGSGGRINAFRAVADSDAVPPGPVRDLRLLHAGATSLTLAWTAPGDDGNAGTAAAYRVLYGAHVDTTQFAQAGIALSLRPGPPGSTDSVTLEGLALRSDYQVAVQALDEWGNASASSAILRARTTGTPSLRAPDTFATQALTGSRFSLGLLLQNVSPFGDLEFSIDPPQTLYRAVSSAPPPPPGPPAIKGAEEPAGSPAPPPRMGGPDAFGYRYVTSDTSVGPTFQWIELAGVVPPVPLRLDDAYDGALPMTLRFPFYGSMFDSLGITTNGFLTFNTPSSAFLNQRLPSPGAPDFLIAPLWDDLHFQSDYLAYIGGDSSRFVVEWRNVPRVAGDGTFTFEAVLGRNGDITLQYLQVQGNATSATVGIQDGTRTRALNVLYNQPGLHDSLAIRIRREPDWLSVSPLSGRIPPGGRQVIDLDIDASGLAGGVYQQAITLHTNDPRAAVRRIPLTLSCRDAPSLEAPATIDFGEVFTATTTDLDVRLHNAGALPLHLRNASVSGGGLTLLASPAIVEPFGSALARLRFAPSGPGPLSGTLRLATDDPNHLALEIPVAASAVPRPALSLPADTLRLQVAAGSQASVSFQLGNTGPGALRARIEAWHPLGDSAALQPAAPGDAPQKGGARPFNMDPGATFVSGPDAFGYRARSSDEVYGPAFDWQEIATPAAALADSGDDWLGFVYVLPAPVPIYGHYPGGIEISSNGWFSSLSNNNSFFGNFHLPHPLGPREALAVLWQDLAEAHATVYAAADTGGVTVEWKDARLVGSNARYTFEGRLEKSGRVVYRYLSMDEPVSLATVGMQNFDFTSGLDVSFGEDRIASGMAVEILPFTRWLKALPETADLAPGASAPVTLTADAGALPIGTYVATVGFDSNDPARRHAELPVRVDVVAPGAAEEHVAGAGAPQPVPPGLDVVTANPSRGRFGVRFSAGTAVSAQVRVLDVTGRQVRALWSGPAAAGSHSVAWDGRSDSGQPVGTGIYWVQLATAGGFRQTRKVALLR